MVMQIVTAKEFRANQTKILIAARDGELIILKSRIGLFKIVPVTDEDTITESIARGLDDIKHGRVHEMARGETLANLLDRIGDANVVTSD